MIEKHRSLTDSRVLVVGVVRNCESTVEQDVLRIREAFRRAAHVEHFVVESDSSDNTVAVLERMKETVENFNFLTLEKLTDRMPKRTERLAFCRNEYLRHARSCHSNRPLDYVVVADLDGINSHLNEAAVISCWERSDWDACFANQRGPYYDIWALRHSLWSPNDCWEQERFFREHLGNKSVSAFLSVYSRQLKIAEDAEWIEVDSAYGGLGIYRADVFTAPGEHVGVDVDGREVCDIPPFHRDIKRLDVKFFINPRMINGEKNEHTARLFFPRVVKLAIRIACFMIYRGVKIR